MEQGTQCSGLQQLAFSLLYFIYYSQGSQSSVSKSFVRDKLQFIFDHHPAEKEKENKIKR